MARRKVNGDALKAIRNLVGIEQADLARRCGITQSALSRIEGENRTASPKVLRALADELGVTLAAITSAVPEEPAELAS